MSLVTQAGWQHFAWIVCIASVVRSVALVANHAQLAADPDAYREIARGLTRFKTFGIVSFEPTTQLASAAPTAFRPPLYPWLLSWITQPDGSLTDGAVAGLHLFLGVFTVAITFLVARRMLADSSRDAGQPIGDPTLVQTSRPGFRSGVAMIAACLVMIDPLLIQSSAQVMTETLATALVVVVLWFWLNVVDSIEANAQAVPSNAPRLMVSSVMLGAAFSLAYLCRPTFIVWPVLMSLYLCGLAVQRKSKRPLIAMAIMSAVVALAVGGWTARNQSQLGHPIWATTHGGYTLLLGNNPPFYEHLRTKGASKIPFLRKNWDAQFFLDRWEQRHHADPRSSLFWEDNRAPGQEVRSVSGVGELAEDRLAYETAKSVIQRDPWGFLLACRWRLERLFSPLPLQTGDRPAKSLWIVGAFYASTFFMIGIGLWQIGREIFAPRWALAIALWVALAAVHTIYWTDMRMRAPAVPILSILAAASIGTRRFGAAKIT